MIDFVVMEVLLLRVLQEDKEHHEQQERKSWKDDKSELRKYAT